MGRQKRGFDEGVGYIRGQRTHFGRQLMGLLNSPQLDGPHELNHRLTHDVLKGTRHRGVKFNEWLGALSCQAEFKYRQALAHQRFVLCIDVLGYETRPAKRVESLRIATIKHRGLSSPN